MSSKTAGKMGNVNGQSLSPMDKEGSLEMWDVGIHVHPDLLLCVSPAVWWVIVEEARQITASEWYPLELSVGDTHLVASGI